MKRKSNIKKLTFAFILGFMSLTAQLNAQKYGSDIIINHTSGRYYSSAKISVAYDRTIYYARLYSTSASVLKQNWEVLKSTDHGYTFSLFAESSVTGNKEFTSIDIVAAGNNAGDFGVFIARSSIDTFSYISQLILDKYAANGTPTNLVNETYHPVGAASARAWGSVCLVSDYRLKNPISNPYSISMAAVKASSYDSIIVWTDVTGGTGMYRKGVASTAFFQKCKYRYWM